MRIKSGYYASVQITSAPNHYRCFSKPFFDTLGRYYKKVTLESAPSIAVVYVR